jgi:uncharacterized Fe-S center protein
MEKKPKVYFTKEISSEKLVEMFKKLNIKLPGNIGVKVHSGEKGNKNFIKPEFFKPLVNYVDGTIIETNTSGGDHPMFARSKTDRHLKLLEEHGWTKTFKKVEILDSEPPDEEIEVENPLRIEKNYIGKNTKKYDSILVLSHFKGHALGGYGGALKQLSIGFASCLGKTIIHSAGKNRDPNKLMTNFCEDKIFKECMADAASTIVKRYRGKMAFINCMVNISIDCDCDGNAKPPCMKDIGILSSTDPVALDQACLDLIYNSEQEGKEQLIKRIESKYGLHIIDCAVKHGMGKKEYELINVD